MNIAVVGAGVSGLTSAIVLAERGFSPHVIASRPAESSTSGAAAAIWYPYEAEPLETVTAWALITYGRLLALSQERESGVSLIEFRFFSRDASIEPAAWAAAIGYRILSREEILTSYVSGFAMTVPLMDARRYLPYLRRRLQTLGGSITEGSHLDRLEDAGDRFDVIVNCTGYGARTLVPDEELEPHRGQSVLADPLDAPELSFAFVSLDEPLTYVIPRSRDWVLGGLNEISENMESDAATDTRIVDECSRVLGPKLRSPVRIASSRVGLRPFRRTGVRVEAAHLTDGRVVIHNYGHGGAGFTLSWGCAHAVAELASRLR